ncbi:hypothetical protein PSP31121_03667 [Pandoraea sputorum]|uniref:Uncharacterized protein n=1 Tax=Pandoraea sputorum TaxID=93222 RepID=A0A5E5BAQ7_9BURK|nr:hypothetical protein PSP31121_03667 [Pandoraea sputorum]
MLQDKDCSLGTGVIVDVVIQISAKANLLYPQYQALPLADFSSSSSD